MTDCTCGTDATSLNPAEVVTHRADRPCSVEPSMIPAYYWLTLHAAEIGDLPYSVLLDLYTGVTLQGDPDTVACLARLWHLPVDKTRTGESWNAWSGHVGGVPVRVVESKS